MLPLGSKRNTQETLLAINENERTKEFSQSTF